MSMKTPEWVKNAIFYQIFPDRFARSPRLQHPPGMKFKPWGSSPREQGFQGGDLLGVVDKLDYLQDLGVTAIYLNPIFASACNHRYHPYDYLQVDPLLGGNPALRELLDEAHKRNMRIVLDGVFNHASRGFWPFHHILENGTKSPYLDWFIIKGWPLRPYSNNRKRPHNYEAWWNLPMLPKLNTANPAVRQYIFDVAHHWIKFGIDGWRLDVPFEIDDDAFWQKFRRVVKTTNPDAYICGEVWEDARRWLQGDQFDAVMNYIFTWHTISFFGAESLRKTYKRPHLPLHPMDAGEFSRGIQQMLNLYDREVNQAQLNLLDSHDMARALWIMKNDIDALKLCVLFQMTMPGAPCIYYGDEIGLSAGDDPMCREAFPWDHEDRWDKELLTFYQQVTQLRHRFEVLRTGEFRILFAEGQILAFSRELHHKKSMLIFNAGKATQTAMIPAPSEQNLRTLWPLKQQTSFRAAKHGLRVTLPPQDALILINEKC